MAAFFGLPIVSNIINGFVAILPYIFIAGLVIGAYFYGHHTGTTECNAKQLQVIIDKQNKELADLEKQYHDAEITIANLDGKIAADDKALQTALNHLPFVINTKGTCAQSSAFINDINGIRK